jgi:hypothetical protein
MRKALHLFAIVVSPLLCTTLATESTQSRVVVKPQGDVPRPAFLPKRTAQVSGGYRFDNIDKLVKMNRTRLALCLLKNKDLNSTRIAMTLSWEGSGLFRKVGMVPDAGEKVRDCIRELVEGWNVASHPGLQPFTFEAILVPAGF